PSPAAIPAVPATAAAAVTSGVNARILPAVLAASRIGTSRRPHANGSGQHGEGDQAAERRVKT
ncbi:MAG TPA: hypothetical protein VFB81_08105, partial [Myxococcales bacterium]|nr:hypothetical protein [Myxococcales bacterium]